MEQSPSVSSAYNFTLSGPGQYSIEPSNLFTYVDANGTLKDLRATVVDVAAVNLSGTLAISPVHDQRTGFIGCTAIRQSQINAAASGAQTYARSAYYYLLGISSGLARYTTWFGSYVTARKNTVQNHFRLINSRQFSSFTYDCTCKKADTFAFVCACIFQS